MYKGEEIIISDEVVSSLSKEQIRMIIFNYNKVKMLLENRNEVIIKLVEHIKNIERQMNENGIKSEELEEKNMKMLGKVNELEELVKNEYIKNRELVGRIKEMGEKEAERERMGEDSKYRDWETDRKSTRLNSSHRL